MEKPIEHVLKEFICHVVDLQNEDDPAGTGFHREFRVCVDMLVMLYHVRIILSTMLHSNLNLAFCVLSLVVACSYRLCFFLLQGY